MELLLVPWLCLIYHSPLSPGLDFLEFSTSLTIFAQISVIIGKSTGSCTSEFTSLALETVTRICSFVLITAMFSVFPLWSWDNLVQGLSPVSSNAINPNTNNFFCPNSFKYTTVFIIQIPFIFLIPFFFLSQSRISCTILWKYSCQLLKVTRDWVSWTFFKFVKRTF